MTHEERIRLLIGELVKIFEGYATPKHLDTRKKEEDEVRNIVRMINQKFPNDTTAEHIKGTMDRAMLKIKEAHKSRTWPTAADIAMAVSKSMTSHRSALPMNNGPWKADPLELNAKRIRAGEPVGEMYIQGKMAERMLARGLVTEEQLAPYLAYLHHAKPSVNNEDTLS